MFFASCISRDGTCKEEVRDIVAPDERAARCAAKRELRKRGHYACQFHIFLVWRNR